MNEPKIKLLKTVNKSVLSHLRFYLEDNDHKPVDFKRKMISFTCQLIRIRKLGYWYNYSNTNKKYSCSYTYTKTIV